MGIEDTKPPAKMADQGRRVAFDVDSLEDLMNQSIEDQGYTQSRGQTPFAKMPAASATRDGRKKGQALASQRMGFIVVFDISDPDSYTGAQQIIGMRGRPGGIRGH